MGMWVVAWKEVRLLFLFPFSSFLAAWRRVAGAGIWCGHEAKAPALGMRVQWRRALSVHFFFALFICDE
jgi:hypothetical protein